MSLKSIIGQKWWKIGAAAFLSVVLLAACGDDNNDMVPNEPVEEDLDLDVNVEDDNNGDSDLKDKDIEKEDVEDTEEEVMDKNRE